jgi:uncharacterized protein YmfQ (DUF2313 family)
LLSEPPLSFVDADIVYIPDGMNWSGPFNGPAFITDFGLNISSTNDFKTHLFLHEIVTEPPGAFVGFAFLNGSYQFAVLSCHAFLGTITFNFPGNGVSSIPGFLSSDLPKLVEMEFTHTGVDTWNVSVFIDGILQGTDTGITLNNVTDAGGIIDFELEGLGANAIIRNFQVEGQGLPEACTGFEPIDPILNFESNDLFIPYGSQATLSWDTINVDTTNASGGWSGSKGANGSEIVGPLFETTTYSLLAEGPGGSVTSSLTIRVDENPESHRISWYESMMINLLPVGVLWTRLNTTFHNTLQAFAVEMVRIHRLGLKLLDESDPRKTTNELLLPAWERNFLLPDELPLGGESELDRQQVVYAKVINSGGQSRAFFINLAETLGLTITITEGSTLEAARVDTARVDTARVNDVGNNLIWNIEFTAEPTTGALVDKFKSMIERLKPAHTFVTYS